MDYRQAGTTAALAYAKEARYGRGLAGPSTRSGVPFRAQAITVFVATLLLATLLRVAPARAAQQGAAGAALETWVERMNTATDDELRAYVSSSFAESFLQQVPLDQMMAVHAQLRAATPLEIEEIETDHGNAIVALLGTSSGTRLRAQLSVSGNPPLIDGLLLQPAESPDAVPPAPLEWETIDELAAAIIEESGLPGVAIARAEPGSTPTVGVAGVRAMGGTDLIAPDDLFHIGSLTKSMTATALAALVEEGLLRWDATLGELLPDVDMNPAFADIELAQVVRHLGRIPQHQTLDDEQFGRYNTLPGTATEQRGAYVAEVLAMEPLEAGYHYSNAGYSVAAYVGELASGRSWQQLVREEVFEPLGLTSCGFGWPATADRPDEPRGHFGAGATRRVQGLDEYPLGAFMAPAGNVHCSAADLARYGLAHLAGLNGEDGFLRAATIQELHRLEPDGAPYAAGWGIDPESGQHRHNGSAGTFFAYLTIDPQAGMVVAFLANGGIAEGGTASRRAADAVLQRAAQAP